MKNININRNIIYLSVIIVVSYIFLFISIGNYSLKEPDEGRYAEIPREMIELNEYVIPHVNYVKYFEKPPLFYWAVALSYKTFGISEWSFRLTNALAAFFTVLVLYLFVRRLFHEDLAFLSSMILLSSFGFFSMARIVTIDMFFTFWLFLALLAFYAYYREKKPMMVYLFYVSLACATISKGIVALILIGITIVIYLFFEKNLIFLKEMRWIKGFLLYAIITVPWFILISLKERDFLYFFFIDQHVLRFLTTKHKRTGSLFYFIPVLFAGMLPWSFFIPRGIAYLWKIKEMKIFIIWTCVVFIFYSVSRSKLPPYILPIVPSLSIIVGYMFWKQWEYSARFFQEIIFYILLFLIFASAIFLYKSELFIRFIQGMSQEGYDIMNSLKGFALGITVLSFCSLISLLIKKFRQFSAIFSILMFFSLGVITMIILNLPVIDGLNSTKRLAMLINHKGYQVEYIVNYGSYDHTLPFYTKKRIMLASYKGELEMGSQYGDAKRFFLNEEDFFQLFASDARVFCVLKQKRMNRLSQLNFKKITILACQGDRCLISNH